MIVIVIGSALLQHCLTTGGLSALATGLCPASVSFSAESANSLSILRCFQPLLEERTDYRSVPTPFRQWHADDLGKLCVVVGN